MNIWRSKSSLPRSTNANKKTQRPRSGPRRKRADDDDGSSSLSFLVHVPDNIQPGQEFQAWAANRLVRVLCPLGVRPGQAVQITVDGSSSQLVDSDSIPLPWDHDGSSRDYLVSSNPEVQRVDNGLYGPQAETYMVTIPAGVLGGQDFHVTIQGREFTITCPMRALPGTKVPVIPPPPNLNDVVGNEEEHTNDAFHHHDQVEPTQLFEILVPQGVEPGSPFALLAVGVRVLVNCPTNAGPGKKIRFRLPLALTTQSNEPQSETVAMKLSYDKDGWARTIRVSDMKFQWVRMDDHGGVATNKRFNAEKSAYVRKIEFHAGKDARIRDGIISLVPADQAFCESRIGGPDGQDLVTYAEIAEAQVKTFEDKAAWFQEKCTMMHIDWAVGHMGMNVRRSHLVEDSILALKSLSRKDFRKIWRFHYIREEGLDGGGLARDWFNEVTSMLFDPNFGLWQSSESNQMCMMINPASKYVTDDYLDCYRFLGQVMGKALFDKQLVQGHMVQYIYKHMLGWPITFKDIQHLDEEYHMNLKKLKDLSDSGEDLSMMSVDFSTTQDIMGVKEVVELVEDGCDIDVTNDNFPEYLEACLKYRMLDQVKPQLTELMLGFYDVIPEPLLTIFDYQELELLMCGLPSIDMEDWKVNTEYCGDYVDTGVEHQACQWFWEVVEEFDQELRARLLQFVTGTSGVPSCGFGVLQGNDGNVRLFTIHGISLKVCMYPRAHTCFNRIDLPTYESKDDLRDRLKLAVTMVSTGFDIE